MSTLGRASLVTAGVSRCAVLRPRPTRPHRRSVERRSLAQAQPAHSYFFSNTRRYSVRRGVAMHGVRRRGVIRQSQQRWLRPQRAFLVRPQRCGLRVQGALVVRLCARHDVRTRQRTDAQLRCFFPQRTRLPTGSGCSTGWCARCALRSTCPSGCRGRCCRLRPRLGESSRERRSGPQAA